jgi:taurine dioxygenase
MLSVRPTGAALGAEILGVDLAQNLDEATFREIVDLFHRHEVVFFRGQDLTPEQHVAFSRRFGELEIHVRQDCCRPGFPEIFVVSNVIENGKPIGTRDAGLFWHSDLAYMREPSRGSLFYAREVPHDEDGNPLGDTLFASAVAAYDALDAATKRRLEGMKAVHSYVKGYYRDRKSGTSSIRSCARILIPAENVCSSTRAIPRASRAWMRRKAMRCSQHCSRT